MRLWNPFRTWREERQRDREMFVTILAAMKDSVMLAADVNAAQADTLKAIAESQKAYFDQFKTSQKPQGWVVREQDEWIAEQQRLQEFANSPLGGAIDFHLRD